MKYFLPTWINKKYRERLHFFATPLLVLLVVLSSLGGLEFLRALFAPIKVAEAVYTGKQLHTVEFALGGGAGTAATQTGTDNNGVARASDANVYAGNAWNATKGTAGTKTIAIPGSGIRVISAYVDISSTLVTAVNVTDLELALDVSPGPASAEDIAIGQVARNGTGLIYVNTSGTSLLLTAKANATALFQTQTDGEWNAGVSVVGMMSITGPTWYLSTMKLVVTYESNYSTAAHDEIKTVRFPLRSTAAGDTGTRRADCAAGSTCSFRYALDIPDLGADADILDAWFEISYAGAGVDAVTPGINGGTAGTAHNALEALADRGERFIIFRPSIGTPNLTPNVSGQLDIGVATAAVSTLGGELVVTYKYSTGASVQTETIQYFMGQEGALPGTASSSFSKMATIMNGGADPRAIWFRVHDSTTNAAAVNVSGKIGASATTTTRYVTTSANSRTGEMRIVHDMGTATTSWSGSQTMLQADVRHEANTYDGPPGIEAFITFRWSGSLGGAETKTGKFFAGSSGSVPALQNSDNTIPFSVTLPETVPKTYRSSYLATSVLHSDVTAIIAGTVKISLSGSGMLTISEGSEDLEAFHAVYLTQATSTDFLTDAAIPWTTRSFQTIVRGNQPEEYAVSAEMVVTYDVDFEGIEVDVGEGKQVRTVEVVLGGGFGTAITQTGIDAGAVARASDDNVYAGSAWNLTKGTAGTKTVTIPGSGIRVLSAYLDVTSGLVAATDVTDLELALDVSPGPAPGEDISVGQVARNGVTSIYIDNSGVSSPLLSAKANVAALFQTQTDSQWNTGLDVVGMMSITGPTWINATMKLVITYEENFSRVPHTALKTVRFPLLSTAAGDSGTRRADCVAGTTCSFLYTIDTPDLTAGADIVDAWFEVSYVDNAAASVTLSVNGGAVGVAHTPIEALNDGSERYLIYRPAISAPNFTPNATGQLDAVIATSNVGAIGGVVVVTYKYSTGASRQTETVQYWMGQATALPGTASTSFSQTATILNGSSTIRNIWFTVHDSVTTVTTNSTAIGGKIGSSATTTRTYTPTLTLARGGELRIIHDMGSATTSWTGTSTLLSVDIRHNIATYDGPPGIEAFITFHWEGALNGPVTQTAKFFAGSSAAVPALANSDNVLPFTVTLPETVTKTLRSSYLSTSVMHSDVTSIIPGTVRIALSGRAPVTISEGTEDAENFRAIYLTQATSTNFTYNAAIPWGSRAFQLIVRGNQTEEYAVSSEMVVTYDAAFPLKIPLFEQDVFYFYVDNNALLPTDPWPAGAANLSESTSIGAGDIPPDSGDRVRLRMSFNVATTTLLASSTKFQLQYTATSTCASPSAVWSAVGVIGSGSIWRGANTAVTDETNLSTNPPTGGDLLLSLSDRAGSFEESNNSRANPFAVFVGEDVEYDWVLEDNGAATNTQYCFRMTYDNGSAFNLYTLYPRIKTAGYSPETRNWRWYDDEGNETPTTPMANENVGAVNVKYGDIQKLRITVADTRGHNGVNQKFRLQYSTYSDFSQQVSFVDASPACDTQWCYANGVDLDDAPITALLLTDSAFLGRHNEAPTTTSTMGPLANLSYEFEYTIQHTGASANTTYFFRLYDVNNDVAVVKDVAASFPSISTGDTTLDVEIAGLPAFTVTEGETTTITTTPTTVPFGDLSVGVSVIGAHRITVTTNAINGYQVLVSENQNFVSSGGAEIPGVAAPNTAPLAWSTACLSSAPGCFGYHSGDNALFGGSARFSANDTWAEFEIPAREVMFASAPVASDTMDMLYRVERNALLPAGEYEAQLRYIVVPSF